MLNKTRSAFYTYLIIAFSLTVLAIIVFGDSQDGSGERGGWFLRNIIYDFQTLFTGLLAVGAAFLTVRAMYTVDGEAEKRHKQALAIAQRPDQIRLERALNPQMYDFSGRLKHLTKVKGLLEASIGEDVVFHEALTATETSRVARGIRNIMNRKAFQYGEVMFEGALTKDLNTLEIRTGEILKYMKPDLLRYEKKILAKYIDDATALITRILRLMSRAKKEHDIK